jgi:hypothetical protein
MLRSCFRAPCDHPQSARRHLVRAGCGNIVNMFRCLLIVVIAASTLPAVVFAQDASSDEHVRHEVRRDQALPEGQDEQAPKRIFGIIPNYRTSPTLTDYQPLTAKEKFKVALDDSLDPGTFVLAALFAGEAQLTHAAPSFGHGVSAYSRYYAASLTDFVVGDLMTEAVYPAALRQDPRYFRRGTGGGWARLGYAVGQIFWTHTDSGGTQFNFSEIVGNATAVGISNAYYPDNRTVSGNASKLSIQIGVDVVSNILKEFSPDLERVFSRPHAGAPPPP